MSRTRNAAVLVAVSLSLVAIGLVMLYSATGVMAEKSPRYQDSAWFLKRQLVWVLLGGVAMALTARAVTRLAGFLSGRTLDRSRARRAPVSARRLSRALAGRNTIAASR